MITHTHTLTVSQSACCSITSSSSRRSSVILLHFENFAHKLNKLINQCTCERRQIPQPRAQVCRFERQESRGVRCSVSGEREAEAPLYRRAQLGPTEPNEVRSSPEEAAAERSALTRAAAASVRFALPLQRRA